MSVYLDYNPIAVRDPADTLVAFGYQQLRFLGSVSVIQNAGQTQVTIGGGASINVEQGGVPVLSTGALNFIGANVVNNAGTADITISGGVSGNPNRIAYFDGVGNITDNASLTFDDALIKVGIGTLPLIGGQRHLIVGQITNISGSVRDAIVVGSHTDLGSQPIDRSFFGGINNTTIGVGSVSNSVVVGSTNSCQSVADSLVAGIQNTYTNVSSIVDISQQSTMTSASFSVIATGLTTINGSSFSFVGGISHTLVQGVNASLIGGIQLSLNNIQSSCIIGDSHPCVSVLYSFVGGSLNTLTNIEASLVVGELCNNNGINSVALLGRGLFGTQIWSTVVGEFNETAVSSKKFAVGIGTSSISRLDGFYVETNGDVTVDRQVKLREGANKAMGVATLAGGTVTVNNTLVTANSRIFLTGQNAGTGTPAEVYVSARNAGVDFTITSTDITDDRDIAYIIFEPGV